MLNTRVILSQKKKYVCFRCPDLKHFIVNLSKMLSILLKNSEKFIEKCNFYIRYFDKIKCYSDQPYLVFSELNPETNIYFFGLKSVWGLSTCHYAGNVFPGKIVKKFWQLTWNTQTQTEKLYPLVCNTKILKKKSAHERSWNVEYTRKFA